MCVHQAQGTKAVLSRGKSVTQSGVAQQSSRTFTPLRPHGAWFTHEDTQPGRPDSPEAPFLLFSRPRARKALDYLGLFRHRHMKLRHPSPQKKKKSQSKFSRWPTPSMFGTEQALPRMSPLGTFLLPPSGGGAVFRRYGLQRGWVRLPDGCGWCCGAWSLAPTGPPQDA